MPSGLYNAEAGFPDLDGIAGTDGKLRAVQDYLYILLETLRWTLRNLSPENINEREMREWVQRVERETILGDGLNGADGASGGGGGGTGGGGSSGGGTIGDTLISRFLIENGRLADELYADYGAVADLTVDELRTDWKKAQRFLDGDASPLDYLHIHDEAVDFRTGTVRFADGAPLTEQLRRGERRFWWRDAEKTRMTAREETGRPVIVYQYDELLKGTLRFEDCTPPGAQTVTKVPTFILGAGYGMAADPDRGRGFLRKGTDSFDVWLRNAAGEERGMFIGEQYTDIAGLRKTAALDFSEWDAGHFSETVDGGLGSRLAVRFDAQGRPVRITDAAGHATEIRWE